MTFILRNYIAFWGQPKPSASQIAKFTIEVFTVANFNYQLPFVTTSYTITSYNKAGACLRDIYISMK
jgi:hypothetical protein